MTNEELVRESLLHIENEDKDTDIRVSNASLICFYLENCDIAFGEEKRFFADLSCAEAMGPVMERRIDALGITETPGERILAYTGSNDFGHTSPDWAAVLSLGIFGLRRRLADYAEANRDPEKEVFYREGIRVYDAALAMMARVRDAALAEGRTEMAEGLSRLLRGAPSNLFEAMQTTVIYYALQMHTEGAAVRTLGRVDSLYLPFFEKESDPAFVRGLIRSFYLEINGWKIPANIPIALGADPMRGLPANPLTMLFLEEYRALVLPWTKLHLLCRPDTPREVLAEAFAAVREGKSSILFMSDGKITESLIRLGEAEGDARDYHVVGCYECGGMGELTCSCNARISLPKALEYALTGGIDMLTGEAIGLARAGELSDFDSLFAEFLRQARYLTDKAIEITSVYERQYPACFSAPFLSSTYESALLRGGDLYADFSAKYNNSSINALGLATAVDSLFAIRKLVYEEKTLSLDALTRILCDDWRGHEPLALTTKNRFPKYGRGMPEVDHLARETVDALGEYVNGRANVRGGVWRLGLFSIDWRWDFGEHTGASANGRHAHEPISQNTGADFGMDRDGATAHMLSLTAIDAGKTPNGSVLDLDIHLSAVSGEEGMHALISGLNAYFALGGFAVHYNILDTETLKRAKAHPADYPNLQVRLCGWNVLFNTLTEKEKDEFIARFEHQGGVAS